MPRDTVEKLRQALAQDRKDYEAEVARLATIARDAEERCIRAEHEAVRLKAIMMVLKSALEQAEQ
jgi:hypothetical protein